MLRFLTAAAAFVVACPAWADPLDKPIDGPKTICFKYSTFALQSGERIVDFSGSMEGMLIRVEDAYGGFEVSESEIFAYADGVRRLVSVHGQTKVYRVSGRYVRYAIYGPTDFSDGKDRLLIWLSGKSLRGGKADRLIVDRFDVRDTGKASCEQTFTYSWETFLPSPP